MSAVATFKIKKMRGLIGMVGVAASTQDGQSQYVFLAPDTEALKRLMKERFPEMDLSDEKFIPAFLTKP